MKTNVILSICFYIALIHSAAHDVDVFSLVRDMADGDQTEIRNRAHRNNNAVVNQWRQEHGLAPLDSKKLQTIVDDDIVEHLVAVPNLPDPVEEHGRKATNLVASSKVNWLFFR